MIEITLEDLEKLQELNNLYEAPQYLIEPSPTIWSSPFREQLPRGTTVTVLDAEIQNWGEYNAIVELGFPYGESTHALARIRDDGEVYPAAAEKTSNEKKFPYTVWAETSSGDHATVNTADYLSAKSQADRWLESRWFVKVWVTFNSDELEVQDIVYEAEVAL